MSKSGDNPTQGEISIGEKMVEGPAKAAIIDSDGDCIPDYLVLNIRWVVVSVISLVTTAIGSLFLL